WKRWIAIASGFARDGVDLRHGQAEQAVFDGLPRGEQYGCLVNARLRLNLEDAARGLHIFRDVVIAWPARAKGHRHSLLRGRKLKTGMLQHGPGAEPNAIFAGLLRGEAFRECAVGPAWRTE